MLRIFEYFAVMQNGSTQKIGTVSYAYYRNYGRAFSRL